MSRTIITDVDGTILHWMAGFVDWMGERGKPRLIHHQTSYDLAATFGVSREDLNSYIDEFFNSEAIGCLPPEPCAAEVLPRLHAAGRRFVAVSACPTTFFVVAMRTVNLQDAFGFPWNDVHCVGVHADKRAALRRFEPSIWVEDHFENAVAGAECGHRTFLLDRTYNQGRDHPDVERVKDWHEIAARIA